MLSSHIIRTFLKSLRNSSWVAVFSLKSSLKNLKITFNTTFLHFLFDLSRLCFWIIPLTVEKSVGFENHCNLRRFFSITWSSKEVKGSLKKSIKGRGRTPKILGILIDILMSPNQIAKTSEKNGVLTKICVFFLKTQMLSKKARWNGKDLEEKNS